MIIPLRLARLLFRAGSTRLARGGAGVGEEDDERTHVLSMGQQVFQHWPIDATGPDVLLASSG